MPSSWTWVPFWGLFSIFIHHGKWWMPWGWDFAKLAYLWQEKDGIIEEKAPIYFSILNVCFLFMLCNAYMFTVIPERINNRPEYLETCKVSTHQWLIVALYVGLTIETSSEVFTRIGFCSCEIITSRLFEFGLVISVAILL